MVALDRRRLPCQELGASGFRRSRGFTYITVLILMAIMGAGLAAVGTVWHQAAQREKEKELLFAGGEFRRAIGSYFEGSPGAGQYPKSLEDLLLDARLPGVRRHLRKLYVDPMTGTRDWGLVKEPGGGILGVYSKATGKPLKTAKFREEDKSFAAAAAYSEWKFSYSLGISAGAQTAALPGTVGAFPSATPELNEEIPAVPIAPPTDPSSLKDDPAREARRPGCEQQRQRAAAECEASGPTSVQNPGAIGCVARVAQRFTACLDGTAPAAPAPPG